MMPGLSCGQDMAIQHPQGTTAGVGLVIDAAPAGVRTGNATTSKTISAASRDTVYHRYAAQRTNGQNPKRRTKALLRRVVPDLNEVGLVDLIPNPMHPGQPGPK
jgi:hypothetical protein